MSASSSNRSPGFNLPDEILAVIPTDPFDQLDIARKITSIAISSRVSDLDLSVASLRQSVSEKDRIIQELQDEVSRLECVVRDSNTRVQDVLNDNVRLRGERQTLETTVKRLTRDLSKLENFKRHLMQSLNEENFSETGTTRMIESSNIENKDSVIPFKTSRVTSSTTSPRLYSQYSAASSPKTTSPLKSLIDGKIVLLPSSYPSSQQSSTGTTPINGRALSGRSLRVDGKEIFRLARNRLSYEEFSAFLASIKELNAHKKTHDETLKKVEEIFGSENIDLYQSFKEMLSHKLA
ncbi:hypothetical protein ZOSMA_1G00410 [Zostera marina]|uniref:At4g15545-like C-terminal domain-containing protein n=1 Tax=Zostera marina TaxID=29655 RepID=A0A0K9PPB0_ZOSMR|nr:hypothetical protein ZOSMA_1G00410 [Zostera marina]